MKILCDFFYLSTPFFTPPTIWIEKKFFTAHFTMRWCIWSSYSVQFRLMGNGNHFLGMQTKLSSFVALQILGSSGQINYSSFSKKSIPGSCQIEQGMVVPRFFSVILNQPISVVSRLESLSWYPNQIVFFLATHFQYQLPDLIKQ